MSLSTTEAKIPIAMDYIQPPSPIFWTTRNPIKLVIIREDFLFTEEMCGLLLLLLTVTMGALFSILSGGPWRSEHSHRNYNGPPSAQLTSKQFIPHCLWCYIGKHLLGKSWKWSNFLFSDLTYFSPLITTCEPLSGSHRPPMDPRLRASAKANGMGWYQPTSQLNQSFDGIMNCSDVWI